MFITIDPFYTIEEYNQSLHALKNNNIEYKEYINIKAPFDWYIDVPSAPIMTNYEELSDSQERWLVNKIQAARPNEEYKLKRRNNDTGKKALEKFVLNTPLKESSKAEYSCFFKIRNREQMLEISKNLPGIKLWYFGKYYNNKFRVAMCNNSLIRNYITPDEILIEKEQSTLLMEANLNFKVFRNKDKLKKFTETPYFLNGVFKPVKIVQFNLNI